MKKEERLFFALNGADEALLARSERRRPHRRAPLLGLGLAAACLGLLLLPRPLDPSAPAAGGASGSASLGAAAPADSAAGANEPASAEPPLNAGAAAGSSLPGADAGSATLHLLSAPAAAVPDFLLYVNEAVYHVEEQGGVTTVKPNIPADDLPPMVFTVEYEPETALDAAAAAAESALEAEFETVHRAETPLHADGVTLHGDDGAAWDAPQCDVTLVEDGAGGVFRLTARYFTEAAEGHGARFADMTASFRPVLRAADAPDWLTALRETAQTTMAGLFRGEDSGALAAYGEDVTASLSIRSIDYRVDDSENPSSAIVSVCHRVDTEDSLTYLTIELTRADGVWTATFAGLEK